MERFYFVYPEGKKRALTLSYDDGRSYDRRLVALLKKHGLKGTFHLNSGKLGTFDYVTAEEVAELYEGMEVACHGVRHEFLTELTNEQMVREVWNDRLALEALTGKITDGMSYAYGVFSPEIITNLKAYGIKYSRTTISTNRFEIPRDFMQWNPTCHHDADLMGLLETFNKSPEYRHMPLFYVWGHSFEFDQKNNWEHMEEFCEAAGGNPDIWYCTNHEVYDYITAMKRVVFSADGKVAMNPTNLTLYGRVDGELVCLKPGENHL